MQKFFLDKFDGTLISEFGHPVNQIIKDTNEGFPPWVGFVTGEGLSPPGAS
jgi:hypothetical protein